MSEHAASNVATFPASRMKPRAGLVLTGGGARAAYQAGVLKAVRDILGKPARNPFPILAGTSAGAINIACLASTADDFSAGVAKLLAFWERMRRASKGHEPPEFLSDHPSDAHRVSRVRSWLPEAERAYK